MRFVSALLLPLCALFVAGCRAQPFDVSFTVRARLVGADGRGLDGDIILLSAKKPGTDGVPFDFPLHTRTIDGQAGWTDWRHFSYRLHSNEEVLITASDATGESAVVTYSYDDADQDAIAQDREEAGHVAKEIPDLTVIAPNR